MGDNGPVRFLSRQWLDHLSSLTSASSPTTTLSIHQRVTGGPDGPDFPDGDVEYTLRLVGGRVVFEPGPGDADLDLTSDYETAAAISQGFLTPAAAFAAGRLRIGGPVSVVVAHYEALAEIGTLLAGVPGDTTY